MGTQYLPIWYLKNTVWVSAQCLYFCTPCYRGKLLDGAAEDAYGGHAKHGDFYLSRWEHEGAACIAPDVTVALACISIAWQASCRSTNWWWSLLVPVRAVLDDMESLEKSRVEGVSAAIGGGPPIARKGGPKGAGAPAGGPAAGNSAAAQPIVKPGGPVTAARLSGYVFDTVSSSPPPPRH